MMKRAFTLIELMIVVAIIGILASIAVPNFVKFQCRAKQAEAKTALKNITVAEELHRGTNDAYLSGAEADLNIISFAISGNVRRYVLSVTNATATTFRATAVASSGNIDGITYRGQDLVDAVGNPDQWETTQEGGFVPLNDVCR